MTYTTKIKRILYNRSRYLIFMDTRRTNVGLKISSALYYA